jgi:phage terminase small subunit
LKEGQLITTQNINGDPVIKAHPAIGPLNQAFANINRLLREYGLTASSRSNLNARTEEPANTFEDFLNG